MASQSNPKIPPLKDDTPNDEPGRSGERRVAQVTSIASTVSPNPDADASSRSSIRNNPTPLDVIFILFASVALVVLILSFAAVRGTQPFQTLPYWLKSAVSSFWSRFTVGAGTLSTLGVRKWIDRRPAPNYLIWIPAFTVGLLGSVLFSATFVIPPTVPILDGSIAIPRKGETVTRRTFICQGKATGVGPQTHLWLVVEANNHFWPKEREVHVPPGGGIWESTVYEDGATDKFSLSLYAVNAEEEKKIVQWLEDGENTGKYQELSGILGDRLDRVEDLRLKRN
jgi:hypothetical protein